MQARLKVTSTGGLFGSLLAVTVKKAAYNMLPVCQAGIPSTVNFHSVKEGRWLATDQSLMVLHL